MSKSVLSTVCLFIYKTKLKTLTEWTVSGPEGGIAITSVANTEYHPLLEGGGAAGCGIDTKVELRKISEKYHLLIDQWHCIYSLEICINYNIIFQLHGGCAGGRIGTRFLRPRGTSPLKGGQPRGNPGV
jgi:hypothetical protein